MRLTAALFSILALAACAREPQTDAPAGKALSCAASEGGAVTASNAWVREQKDASAMTAAYFSLCNGSMAPVTLTGLRTPIAGMTEFHETSRDEYGVVSMAPTGDIRLAPGERVVFEPGGKHVMLMALPAAIESGTTAPLELDFADGGHVSIDAVARSAVEAASDGAGHDHQ
jgi:copper(I)-binding protein